MVVPSASHCTVHVTSGQCLACNAVVRHPPLRTSYRLFRNSASTSALLSHSQALFLCLVRPPIGTTPAWYTKTMDHVYTGRCRMRKEGRTVPCVQNLQVKSGPRPEPGVFPGSCLRFVRSVPPRIRIRCRCGNIVKDKGRTIRLCPSCVAQTRIKRKNPKTETKIDNAGLMPQQDSCV